MWRNYLTVGLRALARDRAYTIIKIAGLALGLAGCLLILGYIRYERNYDSWLADHDRIFQVQSIIHPPGQPVVHVQTSSLSFYDRLAPDFPQVEAVTSVAVAKTVTEREGRPVFIDATTVDPTFFDVFDLPFAQGSAASALADTNTIVLTEREAIRWFGTADALGKSLTLGAGDGKRDYKVGGVLRDLPRNTNLKLGLIFRRDLGALPPERRNWSNFDQQNFVKLRSTADVDAVNAGLPAWEKRVIPTTMVGGKPAELSEAFDFRLLAIGDVHLGQAQEGAYVPGGDPRALATFGIVAALTLGMALMNFVNLSTAAAAQRAREVGLRKLMGATRRQLVLQFVAEGAAVCAAATLLGLAAVEVAMPWVGGLLGAELPIAYLGDGGMLLPALGLFGITMLVGSLYPALYLSRFRPAQVLRSGHTSAEAPGARRLRTALVVAQFAIAIGLIASTAVIWSQTRFVERVDPGYRRDGLVQIDNGWRFTQDPRYQAARAEMLAVPGVIGVGRTGLGLGSVMKAIRLVRTPGSSTFLSMGTYGVDADLLPTMGVKLLAGRHLGDRFAADRISGMPTHMLVARGINVVLNRTAVSALGYHRPQAAVGRRIEVAFDGGIMVPATIVGVTKDTRYRTAREAIEPMVYGYMPEHTSQVLVRYAAARPGEVMAALEKVWRRFEPEIPFEARFADDIVRDLYAVERARTILFAAFSTLAILIACLGLYSLAAFTTERRTKEIGIRKVLGAKARDIVRLLVWQFSKPVVLANLLAWPAAWWAMRAWLNGFDARIALGPSPFVLAGALALAIAVATVAGHALKVARLNPIHALRYE